MRKRRLYRYAQNMRAEGAPVFQHPVRDSGNHVRQEPGRQMFNMAAHEGLITCITPEGDLYLTMPPRRNEFEAGFNAGMQAAQKSSAPKEAQFTYVDIEKARRRGFEEGKSSSVSAGIPNVNEASVRKKMIDQMLEKCRVISESNESMAPGVNAVRHLIKKMA